MRRSSLYIIWLSLLIILISLSLPSCRKSQEMTALTQAEKLAAANPDSARKVLNTIDTNRLRKGDERMLFRLIALEVADKLYEPHTDDREIKQLLKYYIDENHLKAYHPLLLYYAGRVYNDLQQDALSLTYFKKARQAVGEGKDLDLECRINAQLSYIYSDHRLYNHSRRYMERAIRCSELQKDTVNLISESLNLCDVYMSLQQPDTAEMIYKRIEPLVKECDDSVTITTFYTQYAIYYYYVDDYHKADSIFSTLKNLAYDEVARTSVLGIRDKIEQECRNGKVDVELYKSILANPSSEPSLAYRAAKNLAKDAGERGDAKEMLRYTDMAFKLIKKVQNRFNQNTLVEMEKLMEEAELENENLQLTLEVRRKQIVILVCIVIAVLTVGICVALMIRGRMKKIAYALEIEKLQGDIRRMVSRLEAEVRRNKMEEKENVLEEVQALKLQNELRLAKEKEEIISLMTGHAEREVTDENFARLRVAFSETRPDLIEALDNMGLKTKDYQDSLLALIDVPQKICALYFGVTPPAVANSRKRLLKRWDPEGKFKNWKEYLYSLG